ncbi:ABC transporter permease subunit [Arsenicicoccus sp. oral taxon 190]|uniref:ABC transporter permease subunit n=1 Tax=Arsenicicoccus sp. oral taxon 190 TaxID=1658671 RepID=UPI000679F145|nr:ABC transporter permease subunit [Arsenicicoccus sp. oral taxon 190]AKT50278.1 sugar ABC transporter permease [Arsenicicoccus sp. oral taxon 190]
MKTVYLAIKWLLVAAALAVCFWLATQLATQGYALAVAVVAFVAMAILLIYSTRRFVPMKYLFPGILALIGLQIWPMVFTVSMAFTNYGNGHLGTKQESVQSIVANSVQQVPGAPKYKASIAVPSGADVATGELHMLLADPTTKKVYDGTTKELKDLDPGKVTQSSVGKITAAEGFTVLKPREVNARSKDLGTFAVPTQDGGGIKLLGLSEAFVGKAAVIYDAGKDQLTDTKTNKTYVAKDGRWVATDGSGAFSQGWKENVGLKNFQTIFSDPNIRGKFLGIFVWNVFFAAATVVLTFLLGMLIALLFNTPNLRFKGLYRSLLILPYAIPSFVTALLWRGMFNQDYGLINTVLHLGVDWLGNDWAARAALIITNLWLGFPYMFLVCTGALQSIPGDVKEAAKIDGANGVQTLVRITMPLLLVAVGPLLIASYGFNFNNFSLVYLLTEGGPFNSGNSQMGATDLLITYAYRVAFAGEAPNYGLAAAVSVVIFALVAVMSLPGFRATKALEEVN